MDTNNKIYFTRGYYEIDWSRLGTMQQSLLENKKINYIMSTMHMNKGSRLSRIELKIDVFIDELI